MRNVLDLYLLSPMLGGHSPRDGPHWRVLLGVRLMGTIRTTRKMCTGILILSGAASMELQILVRGFVRDESKRFRALGFADCRFKIKSFYIKGEENLCHGTKLQGSRFWK